MIEIKSKNKNYAVNFPTSINEITVEHLNQITKDIKLPKYYCLVALCFKTKLFDFVTTIKSNKISDISVTPIVAKINDSDKDSILSVGDIAILDRTSIELGNHVKVDTAIASNNAKQYFLSDAELMKDIVTKQHVNKQPLCIKSDKIIIIEFKIVPVNNIHGTLPRNINVNDPFIKDIKEENNNKER